jgi:hypothetical protein
VDGGGTCEFVATWENADPPAVYGLFFDNVFQGTIPGSTTDVTFFQVAAGRHCVTIVGSESTMAGQYLGCALESCCDLACLPTEACNPPSALLACQLAYGPAAADNAVLLGWLNGKSRYARGLNLYRDGALELFVPTDPLEGNPSQYLFGGLAPGEHAFGVQGDCGAPDGLSSIAAASLEVLTQTPHTSPIEGQPSCTWSAANGGTTTVTWTNDDPSAFIQVYVEVGMTLFAVGLIPGSRTGVDVFGTLATDPIVLQFFVSQGGRCYGSEFVRCVPGTGARSRFIRGLCDGTGELPTISSAIYLFNFLFLGGNPPPCRVACDANGDGEVNISDGSYVLNFLFLGASAPPGWVDSDADGRRDPTCVEAAAGEDCAASHAACGG